MPFQATLVEELWRIRCGDGWAHASIWTHSQGWELRLLWEGMPAWRFVDADRAAVERAGDAAEVRLTRDGKEGLSDLRSEAHPRGRSARG